MQVLDRRKAMAIAPLLRLAFRPFFLAGCLLAVLAIPLWLAAFSGSIADWQPAGGGWAGTDMNCCSVLAWRLLPASC